MIVGMDAVESPRVLCKYRQVAEYTAGVMLAGYGTVPDRNAVCQDGIEQSVNGCAAIIMTAIDKLFTMPKDIQILDGIVTANDHIRKFAHYIGQGIYIDGVITFFSGMKFTCIPFGNAAVYAGANLRTMAEPNQRNAIGCAEIWQGAVLSGELTEPLICTTEALPNLAQCQQLIADNISVHRNAIPMLLRREPPGISAVMRFASD